MKICLVASGNGTGHARRLLQLMSGLQGLKEESTLLINLNQIKRLKNEISALKVDPQRVKMIPRFNFDGFVEKKVTGSINREISDFIKDQNVVISDNASWPIEFNPNSYFHGHFLWPEIIREDSHKSEIRFAKEASLSVSAKGWIRNEQFKIIEPTKVVDVKRTFPINNLRYKDDEYIRSLKIKDNEVWISTGTIQSNIEAAVASKTLANSKYLFKFHETFEMFHLGYRPLAVIGRAGYGTIRDCLASGVIFIPLEINSDIETNSNIRNLQNLQVLPLFHRDLNINFSLFEQIIDLSKAQSERIGIWESISSDALYYAKSVLNIVS
jgi:hypothetical protein